MIPLCGKGDLRGTGRTTRQLNKAMAYIQSGRNVLFVCRTSVEADYTASLLYWVAFPDKCFRATRSLHYGPLVVQIRSIESGVSCIQGWRGRVIFDHNTCPEVGSHEREWSEWDKWNEVAWNINSRG